MDIAGGVFSAENIHLFPILATDMSTFLKQLFLFLLPLLMLFIPASAVLFLSGEFYSLQAIEKQQQQGVPVVVGPAYSNFVQVFKQESALLRRPTILALGNSHVEQFRSAFFKEPSSFYNATGAVGALSDLTFFVQGLGQHVPSIVVMSLDQGSFDPTQHEDHIVRLNPFTMHVGYADTVVESLIRQQSWWKLYRDYASGKFSLSDLASGGDVSLVGLEARAGVGGYITDGSYHYGEKQSDQNAQEKTASDIAALAASISDTHGFAFGNTISPDAVRELRRFLEMCKEKHIFVIGFLPPLPQQVYRKLDSFPAAPYHAMLRELPEMLAGIYRDYGFDFYDFSQPASFGSSDKEMVNPYHGSEKMYLRMTLAMAQGSPMLKDMVDPSFLEKRLRDAKDDYLVFGIEE